MDISEGKLPFEDNYFDEILSEDYMQKIPSGKVIQVMGELHRILRPGGSLIIIVPIFPTEYAAADPETQSFWSPMTFIRFSQEYYDKLKAPVPFDYIFHLGEGTLFLIKWKNEQTGIFQLMQCKAILTKL
jgi:SAM-dependent methyltransferase